MSARVSISRRTAQQLLQIVSESPWEGRVAEELRRALQSGIKSGKAKAERRRTKTAKVESKRDETARIRREVFERAGDACEICGDRATDLHHAFGRVRVRQAASSCLALCRRCHRDFTENAYSAPLGWEIQAQAFLRRGLNESAARCMRQAKWAEAKRGGAA